MSDEPRKRSRFDQAPPSRFDRRSRSPPNRVHESRRSRSPLGQSASPSSAGTKADAVARAAEAAARINSQLQAKKAVQTIDVPPIRTAASTTPTASNSDANAANEVYQQDGDFIKDIEINDLRNRYTLTKGSTQKMIKEDTGADVTTRGEYYPDKTMATAASPPLYLHVTSTTKEGLDKAVAKINELMQQELPNLVDERRFRRREPEQFERDELGRRKWPEERISIDLEPIPGFNLRAQVVGHGGAYVKHIQQETRCRVQIKGRGSGFMENSTGQESDEPMYLHVAGPDPEQVQRAKELCLDLLSNVKDQYEQFKERGPRHNNHDHYGGDRRRDYGDRDRSQSYGGQSNYGGYGGHQSPAGAGGAMSPLNAAPGTPGTPAAQGADYAAQYAQYYAQNGGDPYAAYGGYQNYINYYYAYMAQQQGGQQSPQPGPPGAGPPGSGPPGAGAPPPPPDEAPPPPPPGAPSSGYNAMPPPPGL